MRACGLILMFMMLRSAPAADGSIFFPGYPKVFMGEHVVGQMPTGWTTVMWGVPPHSIGDGVFISDGIMFVPRGQSKEEWTESVLLLTYKGLRTQHAGDALARVIDKRPAAICEHYRSARVEVDVQNNYPTAFTSYFCGHNPDSGSGEIAVVKAVIAKNDDLLVLTRIVRVKPFDYGRNAADFIEQKAAELSAWVQGFYLCDKSDARRPCPPGR